MIIVCEKCLAKYKVQETAISPAGRKVKCTSCAHTWVQYPIEEKKEEKPEKVPEEQSKPNAKQEKEQTSQKAELKKVKEKTELKTLDDTSASLNLLLKIASAILIIALFASSALLFHQKLYKAPLFSTFYSSLGLFSIKGLEFRNVKFRKIKNGDKYVLLIKGYVLNNSDKTIKLPALYIYLFDKSGKEMARLDYAIDTKELEPEKKAPFEPKINNVPEAVSHIEVYLASPFDLAFK